MWRLYNLISNNGSYSCTSRNMVPFLFPLPEFSKSVLIHYALIKHFFNYLEALISFSWILIKHALNSKPFKVNIIMLSFYFLYPFTAFRLTSNPFLLNLNSRGSQSIHHGYNECQQILSRGPHRICWCKVVVWFGIPYWHSSYISNSLTNLLLGTKLYFYNLKKKNCIQ